MKNAADSKDTIDQTPAAGQPLLSILTYLTAALLLGLDQLSKWQILATLDHRSSRPLLGDWLYLTHVHNEGAAFSILTGQKLWLSLIAILVAGWIVGYERKLKQRDPMQLVALGCILAGSLGNLVDRLRLGYVVDFLDLHAHGGNIWPIFNVADMCINLGVALLVLYFWRHPESASGPATVPKTAFKEERSLASPAEASIKKT